MSPYFHTSHPNIAIYSQDMHYMWAQPEVLEKEKCVITNKYI